MADRTRSGKGAEQEEAGRAHPGRHPAEEELLVTGSPAAVALGMLYIEAAAAGSVLIMDALQQQRHGALLQTAVTCEAVHRLLDNRYLDRAFEAILGASRAPAHANGE